jgi:hypothetical protein
MLNSRHKEADPMSNLIETLKVSEEYSPYFKPRLHEVSVSLPYENQPKTGEIAFFNVYTTVRLYGGPEEGGWYYNYTNLEFCVPFLYENEETLKLMIKAHEERIKELPRGDIYSVNGGQNAFIMIEKTAGESASTEHPHYE